MISDAYLAELAARDPGNGRFTEEEQAALAMAAPVLAAEELRRRGRLAANPPADTSKVIDIRLRRAERVINSDCATPDEIEDACRIILTHSPKPFWQTAAREVLKSMGVAA
jgi:hypothetical protein